MTDVQDTTAAPATAKETKISNREFIGPDGKEVENPMEATGARYTFILDEGGSVEAQVDDLIANGHKDVVCAFFGGGLHVYAGNVANRIRNGQVKADGPQTVKEALAAWWDNLMAGNWTLPRGEVVAGVGLLAEALKRFKDKLDGGILKDGTPRTIESVTAYLDKTTKEERTAMRKQVAKEIFEIQQERAAQKPVDTTAIAQADF